MAELPAVLDRTTPTGLRALDDRDQLELALRARSRARWQRTVVAVGVVIVVAAGLLVAAGLSGGPNDRDLQRWRGPGGVALDEPVGRWTRADDAPFALGATVFAGRLSDGRVLVWGGRRGNETTLEGGIYDLSSGRWEAIPAAPLEPGFEPGTFQEQVQLAGDRLVVVTTDARTRRGDAQAAVFDAAQGRWLDLPPVDLAEAPLSFGAVAWDGHTLALFPRPVGADIRFEPVTWRWTVGDDAWERGTSAPIGLRTRVGVAFDGRRMAFWGGSINGRVQDDGAVYDLSTDSWELISDAPIPGAEDPVVVWLGGQVAVSWPAFGAGDPAEQRGEASGVAVYDLVADRWATIRAPDPQVEGHPPLAASSGAGYVPPDRSTVGPGASAARFLVSARPFASDEEIGEPWFYDGDSWERAPFPALVRLGGFTVALEGLDFLEACCPEPSPLSMRVRVGPGRWLEAAEAPFPPGAYEAVVVSDDKLLVVGGLRGRHPGAESEPTAETWVFDLAG